jgi:acetyl/propionyl-CoA carboxylase alpha subunit
MGVTAVHPGYGFLSENADFAKRCADFGITFIGPSPESTIKLGNKVSAKTIALAAKVPMAAHCELPAKDRLKAAKKFCTDTGYPIVVKAAGGGGGRGMRLVKKEQELEEALSSAAREAEAFFKDPNIFLEQYVTPARHIEVQILGDKHGNVYAIGDRDCTFQRRYQKVIEEAPAPNISSATRTKLHKHAIALGQRAGYYGAGTVEFLLRGEEIFFLEVNSRLQVEHPVTEMAFGLDLVEQQIRIACSEKLSGALAKLAPLRHSIELRLTSEVPENDFAPSTGSIVALNLPTGSGVRVDSGFEVGSYVSHYYDSLIAKLIFTGADREEALSLAQTGIAETFVAGVRTNAGFLTSLLGSIEFKDVSHHITLAESFAKRAEPANFPQIAAAVFCIVGKAGAKEHPAQLRLGRSEQRVLVNGKQTVIVLDQLASGFLISSTHENELPALSINFTDSNGRLSVNGSDLAVTYSETLPFWVKIEGYYFECAWPIAASAGADGLHSKELRAPLPGRIVKVNVTEGQMVAAGEALIVIESMKMEHVLKASAPGAIKNLRLKTGSAVQRDDIILVIE